MQVCLNSALFKFAPAKSASAKYASRKYAPLKSAPAKYASAKYASLKTAPLKSAQRKSAPFKFASNKSASRKSAPLKFALDLTAASTHFFIEAHSRENKTVPVVLCLISIMVASLCLLCIPAPVDNNQDI